MENANNPEMGTGLTQNDAASLISGILDSDTAATVETADVENETDEVSQNVQHEEIEATEEHADEHSEVADEVHVEDTQDNQEATSPIADDYEVDLDGTKITMKELKSGYLRQSDYTRKTQEVADAKKTFDTNLGTLRNQAVQRLSAMENDIMALLPAQPNWKQLAAESPAEYVEQKEIWQERFNRINALKQERAALEQQNAVEERKQYEQTVRQGQERLKQELPELFEPNTQREFISYIQKAGFTTNDVNAVTDHRLFVLARKAMLYDALQSQKAEAVKKVASKPPLTKPGTNTARVSSAQSSYERDVKRLNKTGSVNDAASVLKHLL